MLEIRKHDNHRTTISYDMEWIISILYPYCLMGYIPISPKSHRCHRCQGAGRLSTKPSWASSQACWKSSCDPLRNGWSVHGDFTIAAIAGWWFQWMMTGWLIWWKLSLKYGWWLGNTAWWYTYMFQPTPLKNMTSWGRQIGMIFHSQLFLESHNPFMFQSPPTR